jgi:hypothetical protein
MITNACAVRKLMAQRQCEVIARASPLHNQSHASFTAVIKVSTKLIKFFMKAETPPHLHSPCHYRA